MKKQISSTVNQIFSLSLDVSIDLQTYVKPREQSRFVAEAIRKQQEDKKEELRKAYLSANNDAGQKEAIDDWDSYQRNIRESII